MLVLPENNFYRALLFVATVILTITYAWLGARLMAPRSSFPTALVSSVQWVSRGVSASPESSPTFDWLAYDRMRTEAKSLAPSVQMIGGLQKPVRLIINHDEPNTLRISDGSIEIGFELASAKGQISKAFLKTWLVQNADVSVSGSLLRMEVVTDALLAMMSGGLSLASPTQTDGSATLGRPSNWLAYAGSMEDVCASTWIIPELQSLCRSRSAGAVSEMSPLAFRALLGDVIWSFYATIPPTKQLNVLQAWAAHLRRRSQTDSSAKDFFQLGSLAEWRDRLRAEVDLLFPVELQSLSRERDALVERARLAPDQVPEVDFLSVRNIGSTGRMSPIVAPGRRGRALEFAAVDQRASEIRRGSLVLRPGVSSLGESRELAARTLVWESCASPSISDLTSMLIEARTALVIENCSGVPMDLSSLKHGVSDFARANPDAVFIQLRMEGVRFALKKGIVETSSRAIDLAKALPARSSGKDPFGIEKAQWKGDLAAFKTLGAIEAVEWFRPREKTGPKVVPAAHREVNPKK